MNFPIARGSYSTLSHSLYYCRSSEPGVDAFVLIARSVSGNSFTYTSGQGLQPYGLAWPTNVSNYCVSQGWAVAMLRSATMRHMAGAPGPSNWLLTHQNSFLLSII